MNFTIWYYKRMLDALYLSFFNSHNPFFKDWTSFWIILLESRGINFERFAYRIISIASILQYRLSKQFLPCTVISFFIARKLSCRFVSCDESEFWGWLLLPAQSKKTNVAKWLASSSAWTKHSKTLQRCVALLFRRFSRDFALILSVFEGWVSRVEEARSRFRWNDFEPHPLYSHSSFSSVDLKLLFFSFFFDVWSIEYRIY